ncbi:LysR substrate-binding domain-containing protein [uncultured Ruegeria sp.]|uniref:LysR substrate-binding domain-containing protein n=1 Tax=uncultured Ruegeria sp. TaxID=259304 RepID=UPI00345BBBF0
MDALRRLVSIEMGVSLFPEFYARSEIPERGEVVLREIDGCSLTRAISFAWIKGSSRSAQYHLLFDECLPAITQTRQRQGVDV